MFGAGKEKNKIDLMLKEIRKDYERLSREYSRPESLRMQFELRYHDAVEYRLNLLTFLEAEKEAVDDLLRQAETPKEDKKSRRPETAPQQRTAAASASKTSVSGGEERISFADKLIKEFAERIEKYPEIIIHPDAAFEMKKLFGALSCIEKDYWGVIDRVLRNYSGSRRFRDSIDLEPEINRLCSAGLDGLPSALGTYYRMLERVPRDYSEIEREEKRCLISAAGLLKKLQTEIIRALDAGAAASEEEMGWIREAGDYLEGMINDFRLKDLTRLG